MENIPQENFEGTEQNPQAGWDIFLQGELIRESGMEKTKWIMENAGKFREIIEENPELTEEYLKNKEETKKKIKGLLDEKETIH